MNEREGTRKDAAYRWGTGLGVALILYVLSYCLLFKPAIFPRVVYVSTSARALSGVSELPIWLKPYSPLIRVHERWRPSDFGFF